VSEGRQSWLNMLQRSDRDMYTGLAGYNTLARTAALTLSTSVLTTHNRLAVTSSVNDGLYQHRSRITDSCVPVASHPLTDGWATDR
jgi:hypothetical protein